MDLMYIIRGNSKWWAKIDYMWNKWLLKQLGSHLQKMLSHISQEMFKIKFQCIIAVYIKRWNIKAPQIWVRCCSYAKSIRVVWAVGFSFISWNFINRNCYINYLFITLNYNSYHEVKINIWERPFLLVFKLVIIIGASWWRWFVSLLSDLRF